MNRQAPVGWKSAWVVVCILALNVAARADHIRDLQTDAATTNQAAFGHWGADPAIYKQWGTHSNRLIPVYSFGTVAASSSANSFGPVDLRRFSMANSPYRSPEVLKRIYGRIPSHTLNSQADYLDQTNIYDLQMAGFASGKKYVFLVIFDGMDWQTTRAASIYKTQSIAYTSGRGTGLHLQDYTAGGTTQFGFMCTSPHNNGTKTDPNTQTVLNPGGTMFGGYNVEHGGPNPWTPGNDPLYLISKSADKNFLHAYTDSSSSATSMTCGIKTFNDGVNIDPTGIPVRTIAHWAQEQGYSVGAVTSVPISHATPAAAYAHNVERDDYQDLTRDLLGLKSVSHPQVPLSGLDVLIGTGYGDIRKTDLVAATETEPAKNPQGSNFVPGNTYLTDADLAAIDVKNGGKYVTAVRTPGVNGRMHLSRSAADAAASGRRLFGFFGTARFKHLPFATADGKYDPTLGRAAAAKTEVYEPADLEENPVLSEMTTAAIQVLARNPKGFWLMVEAGDVDWANHDNNIDSSIGAVLSGDAAVKTVTDWVEANSNWTESMVIVTADHGHYLFLEKPELLITPKP
ncbi:MAG: alkaline phosphatase [Planctomycetes bacterium]|nr:alkaline phosphatase [Planctomycetota bacterium]